MRIGHGYDIHRLQPTGRLVLCGVHVADGLSPVAHSDGDVAIHALVDAILGALGEGDIGELFPDNDDANKGRDSREFLAAAVDRVHAAGYRVGNADVTIIAEKPKLKSHKPAMTAELQRLLDAPANVKAGTNEGCGEIGRGEAIAAHAVVLLTLD